MGNCYKCPPHVQIRIKVENDKIEVIPPSDRALNSLPEYDGQYTFEIPKIVEMNDVRACFKKNPVPIDITGQKEPSTEGEEEP